MYKRRNPRKLRLLSLVLSGSLMAGTVFSLGQMPSAALPVLERLTAASLVTSEPHRALMLLKQQLRPPQSEAVSVPVPVPQAETPEEVIVPVKPPLPPPQPEPRPRPAPMIPEEYRGTITEETMSGHARNRIIPWKSGLIRNDSKFSDEEVTQILAEPDSLSLPAEGPQVLIYHTHATESFEPCDSAVYDTRHTWRSTDNENNIVAVGDIIAEQLERHGISVLHDTTQHDYPSYNGSYERSVKTMEKYLKQYPSIAVTLDIHRDAIQQGNTLIKPVAAINGKKAAQLMIIAGCDDGSMNMPQWRHNLRFAAGIQNEMESLYPGLTRPVFFCYRRYNMHMTTGSLLIEFGSHGNTLEEVQYTGQLAGDAIGQYLARHISSEGA